MATGDKLPVVMGAEKAAPGGVATLGADGKIPEAQLRIPSVELSSDAYSILPDDETGKLTDKVYLVRGGQGSPADPSPDPLLEAVAELRTALEGGNPGEMLAKSGAADYRFAWKPNYFPIPDTPAAHNNFIRGKVLTDSYSLAEILAMVSARDYHDIFAGDIIRVNVPAGSAAGFAGGVTEFLVGEIESHHSYGDSAPLANRGHLLLIPAGTLGSAKMNSTNTTEGAYDGSGMDNTVLPAVQTALETAFGTGHVLTAREWLTSVVNTTMASKVGAGFMGSVTYVVNWVNRKVRLMTELEVYGADPLSSSGYDSFGGLAKQIAVFRQDRESLSIRASWWLSSVCHSTDFCNVNAYSGVNHSNASQSLGVRPRFIIG